jgi:alpha-tubulin suppressor-like RCC1 family protein
MSDPKAKPELWMRPEQDGGPGSRRHFISLCASALSSLFLLPMLVRRAFGSGYYNTAMAGEHAIFAWGGGTLGQLGTGNISNVSSPIMVGSRLAWAQIRAGRTVTLARRRDGTLWAWGQNTSGSLGIGTVTQQSSPVQIGSQNTWSKAFAAEQHVLAIRSDGTLWVWGTNTRAASWG